MYSLLKSGVYRHGGFDNHSIVDSEFLRKIESSFKPGTITPVEIEFDPANKVGYVDELKLKDDELFCSVVLSSEAQAMIDSEGYELAAGIDTFSGSCTLISVGVVRNKLVPYTLQLMDCDPPGV